MTRIKICGLSRNEDVRYVNEAKPDYAGFIINFPKSHRSIGVEQLKRLKACLNREIKAVGVFVDQPVELVAGIAQADLIDLIQLHGNEDESYIKRLRIHTDKPIIQAFMIQSSEDVGRAIRSSAEYILLDAGQGMGVTFDWKLIQSVPRPFFLAGGISASNAEEAISKINPFALDVSSGVETDQKKDKKKIFELLDIVRKK